MRYQAVDLLSQQNAILHQGFKFAHDYCAHPSMPFSYSWAGRLTSAMLETGIRLTQRYDKPEFNINEVMVDGQCIAVRQEVVCNKPFCDLVHFKRIGVATQQKVLLVAPLSGHHATLLRGTVEELLPDHEIYITDWLDARDVPRGVGKFTLDTYVDYLLEFLLFLGPGTHMIAICQPTVQALIATAVLAQQDDPCVPRSLTLMAGPIDTSLNPTRVNEFAHKHPMSWYEQMAIMQVPMGYPGAGRRVYPGFMQLGGFLSMNLQTHIKKYQNFFFNLLYGKQEDAQRFRAFYDEYMAVLDMPAEFYLETIERVFKNNEIATGEITWHGEKVDFSAIQNTALLTIEGADDDIVGEGQTKAAQTVCQKIPKHMRQHHLQAGAGHYGIFSGSKFRESVRPVISSFIHQYDDVTRPPESINNQQVKKRTRKASARRANAKENQPNQE